MTSPYTNRCDYIKKLRAEESSSLEIFTDVEEVQKLVKKQEDAAGMTGQRGWQRAQAEAGIWDDDKVHYGD